MSGLSGRGSAGSVATRQSRRRLSVPGTPEHLQDRLDCRGLPALAMTRLGPS
jgi:hypothetical protein